MYEIYRQTLIGKALMETLDEMVRDNSLNSIQAKFILEKFDESIPIALDRLGSTTLSFKGSIETYNYVSGVWKFVVKDLMIYINNKYHKTGLMKIVACDDSETDTEGPRRRKKKT